MFPILDVIAVHMLCLRFRNSAYVHVYQVDSFSMQYSISTAKGVVQCTSVPLAADCETVRGAISIKSYP